VGITSLTTSSWCVLARSGHLENKFSFCKIPSGCEPNAVLIVYLLELAMVKILSVFFHDVWVIRVEGTRNLASDMGMC
jgi:hypothetical protein